MVTDLRESQDKLLPHRKKTKNEYVIEDSDGKHNDDQTNQATRTSDSFFEFIL